MKKLKTRIIARIRALYPDVNLTRARLNALADKLTAKLKDEDEDDAIDEKVEALNDAFSFSEIAKMDDRVRNAESNQRKAGDESDEDEPDTGADKGKGKSDSKTDTSTGGDLAAALQAALSPLLAEITTLKADKVRESRTSILRKSLKDVGLSETQIERSIRNFGKMKFETDDEFDAHLEDEITDAKAEVQRSTEAGLHAAGAPAFGKKYASGISTDTAAYIASKKAGNTTEGKQIFT